MSWNTYYVGDGKRREQTLPDPPPWRIFPRPSLGSQFQPPTGFIDAANAALCLRRPLLLTGPAGSGKSTAIEAVAMEVGLGEIIRWHITSKSTLDDALYRYDVLGRIHAQQLNQSDDDIAPFIQLGPLGTSLLPSDRPRALLIDEIDKSDLDLPSDLLDILERGEYEIPELVRHNTSSVQVRTSDSGQVLHPIENGKVQCTQFPFIVMTSNGERDFPPPFLRRCIRYAMPKLTKAALEAIVIAHLDSDRLKSPMLEDLIERFLAQISRGERVAVDQLLNAAFLLTGANAPTGDKREDLATNLLRELSGA